MFNYVQVLTCNFGSNMKIIDALVWTLRGLTRICIGVDKRLAPAGGRVDRDLLQTTSLVLSSALSQPPARRPGLQFRVPSPPPGPQPLRLERPLRSTSVLHTRPPRRPGALRLVSSDLDSRESFKSNTNNILALIIRFSDFFHLK